MKGPSTLALFVAVVGSGLIGMLIYVGLFYANARRTIRAQSDLESSLFRSREEAENAANEWISLGGIYVVETLTTVKRTVPLTPLEKKKFKSQIDRSMRRKIEAEYSVCLEKSETELAKELCSFGPPKGVVFDEVKIPQEKTIEDEAVKRTDYQRRKCTDDPELRSFECFELDIARDAVMNRSNEDEEIPMKAVQQFRY